MILSNESKDVIELQRLSTLEPLIKRGVLYYNMAPEQYDVLTYIHTTKNKISYIDCCRRFGKDYICLADACLIGSQKNDQILTYLGPTEKAMRRIVSHIILELYKDCTKMQIPDIKPKWNSMDSCWVFPGTNSKIYVTGADNGNYERLRGMTIHKGYLSEAAFMDHLDYIVHDVLLPQTMTTGGNLILISTPPDSPGHESYYIMTDCKSNDACITRTIDDVTRLSDELKEQYIDELGGRDSTACRRELYCEWVTDTESAVLPEFNEECAKAVVREFPLPPYYYAWTAMDPGTADKTGILCGHYDFEKHLFCVDNERLLNKETTVGINEQLLIMEKDIYGEHDVYQRFSDTSMQLIYDLNRLHGLSIQPTAKDDLHANVNNVRVLLQQRRIVIHPRCVNLVRQMRQVIWDKSRKTWIRTTAEGHYDLIAALVYLIRNMNPNMNPFPKRKEFANANQHVNDFADDDRVGDTANTLRHAFRIK